MDDNTKHVGWALSLPSYSCYVIVKYKPEYYNGKEEKLRWNPESNTMAFWREDSDGSVLSIWWRWIESFYVLEL